MVPSGLWDPVRAQSLSAAEHWIHTIYTTYAVFTPKRLTATFGTRSCFDDFVNTSKYPQHCTTHCPEVVQDTARSKHARTQRIHTTTASYSHLPFEQLPPAPAFGQLHSCDGEQPRVPGRPSYPAYPPSPLPPLSPLRPAPKLPHHPSAHRPHRETAAPAVAT